MDRETIKSAEMIICDENMCWLCEHMDDCPINGTWINCPQNAELEAEFQEAAGVAKKGRYDFAPDIMEEIINRDGSCFFCQRGYHMESSTDMRYRIADIMHIVPKSDSGLGVVQNGVVWCR